MYVPSICFHLNYTLGSLTNRCLYGLGNKYVLRSCQLEWSTDHGLGSWGLPAPNAVVFYSLNHMPFLSPNSPKRSRDPGRKQLGNEPLPNPLGQSRWPHLQQGVEARAVLGCAVGGARCLLGSGSSTQESTAASVEDSYGCPAPRGLSPRWALQWQRRCARGSTTHTGTEPARLAPLQRLPGLVAGPVLHFRQEDGKP